MKIQDLVNVADLVWSLATTPAHSRAYKRDGSHGITLDGQAAQIDTGTKVAVRCWLDKRHDKRQYDGMSLGALQNRAEGGDPGVNGRYRILTKHPDPDRSNAYTSNCAHGIFPPLIGHDREHHEWTQVGHARDLKSGEFRRLTKNEAHPKGISHREFSRALDRFYERANGKYAGSRNRDERLDRVDEHPLVRKFRDFHGSTGRPTYDYRQKRNLGVFEHPDGSKHIVARDHGYDSQVERAYTQAARIHRAQDGRPGAEGTEKARRRP
ncbi:MAG: hypothetical protein ACLQU1_07180 [Bryobacteraceae bacterium]